MSVRLWSYTYNTCMTTRLLVVAGILLLGAVGWLWINRQSVTTELVTITARPSVTSTPTPTLEPLRSTMLDVPFGAQAPFGEWNDPRQQDGCEEAATVLVYCALENSECPLTNGRVDKQWLKEKIIDLYDFQVKNWGSGVDTSARDTGERLFKKYFTIDYRVVSVETYEDIGRALMAGYIVVVPTNGKLLNNPNFSHGGPDRHMIVIRGYDRARQEFITQDPGTRQGENYRYDQQVLFEAIRDYPTGNHAMIVGNEKRMIVVN